MADENRLQTELEPMLRGLEKLFNVPERSASLQPLDVHGRGSDAEIRVGKLKFRVRYLSRSYSNAIDDAGKQLRAEFPVPDPNLIPVLIVPYMGPSGQEICQRNHVDWMDLAGNVQIMTDRVVIIVRGSPNKSTRRSGPGDIASPKGSRMIRSLLLNPKSPPTQRQLAHAVNVTEAYVSQFIGRLVRDGVVSKDNEGRIRVLDRNSLLEAWREAYRLERHHILRGYVFARSGVELMRVLSDQLRANNVRHAMTGLAGAWLYDHFAAFRVVSLYLASMPDQALLQSIGFKEDKKAANVWLIVPNDDAVFEGRELIDGVPVVHPLQVYLDLKSHAERAEEAAEHLHASHLKWVANG